MRLLQLLKYTDAATGDVVGAYGISYAVYVLFAVCFAVSFLFGGALKKQKSVLSLGAGKGTQAVIALAFCSFFYDFLHRCRSLYTYIGDAEFTEYNYVVFVALYALSALLCCLYLALMLRSSRGGGCDFTGLGIFNFIPALWAFLRIIIMMMKIVDFREDTESLCEFLYLIFFICFILAAVCALDREDRRTGVAFDAFGLMTFFSSVTVAAPRLIAALTGKADIIYTAQFSSVTYLFTGVITLLLVLGSYSSEAAQSGGTQTNIDVRGRYQLG